MKKILNFILIEDYRRDMSKMEKNKRDCKVALLLLVALLMAVLTMAPLYGESLPKSTKFDLRDEWICPNKTCRYDNYDGIRYCGLCGTERGSRSR